VVIDIDKKLESFSVGTVSNFFGGYIAEEITKVIKNDNSRLNLVSSDYIGAIIAGGFVGLVDVQGFNRAVFALGLNYLMHEVIAKILNEELRSAQELLEDFIFDSILVYIIILFLNQILKMLSIELDKDKSSFSEKVLNRLLTSIVLNVVLNFDVKEKFRELIQKEVVNE